MPKIVSIALLLAACTYPTTKPFGAFKGPGITACGWMVTAYDAGAPHDAGPCDHDAAQVEQQDGSVRVWLECDGTTYIADAPTVDDALAQIESER